jgi:hypothetical protein
MHQASVLFANESSLHFPNAIDTTNRIQATIRTYKDLFHPAINFTFHYRELIHPPSAHLTENGYPLPSIALGNFPEPIAHGYAFADFTSDQTYRF